MAVIQGNIKFTLYFSCTVLRRKKILSIVNVEIIMNFAVSALRLKYELHFYKQSFHFSEITYNFNILWQRPLCIERSYPKKSQVKSYSCNLQKIFCYNFICIDFFSRSFTGTMQRNFCKKISPQLKRQG